MALGMFLRRMVPITLAILSKVDARAAFAHFMVGNTEDWTETEWGLEISDAVDVGLDAFAL